MAASDVMVANEDCVPCRKGQVWRANDGTLMTINAVTEINPSQWTLIRDVDAGPKVGEVWQFKGIDEPIVVGEVDGQHVAFHRPDGSVRRFDMALYVTEAYGYKRLADSVEAWRAQQAPDRLCLGNVDERGVVEILRVPPPPTPIRFEAGHVWEFDGRRFVVESTTRYSAKIRHSDGNSTHWNVNDIAGCNFLGHSLEEACDRERAEHPMRTVRPRDGVELKAGAMVTADQIQKVSAFPSGTHIEFRPVKREGPAPDGSRSVKFEFRLTNGAGEVLDSVAELFGVYRNSMKALGVAFGELGKAVDSPAGRRLISRQNVQQVIDAHRDQPFHTAFMAGMMAWCEVTCDSRDRIYPVQTYEAEQVGRGLVRYETCRGGMTKPRDVHSYWSACYPEAIAAYERARGAK